MLIFLFLIEEIIYIIVGLKILIDLWEIRMEIIISIIIVSIVFMDVLKRNFLKNIYFIVRFMVFRGLRC